jgi:enoyl-CoA hydratase/carnithine racemase
MNPDAPSAAPGDDAAAQPILYRVDGAVARITLNRPRVLNAINGQVHRGLLAALARAEADEEVRVVVLSGNGRAFSAGGDLKAVAADSAQFGEVEISHGWGPPLVITPFTVSLKRAKEILLLGEVFGARLALDIGLVNRVVPGTELEAEADRVASRLAGLAPAAVTGNKRLVNRIYEDAGFLRAEG